jgi:hypothetical protein
MGGYGGLNSLGAGAGAGVGAGVGAGSASGIELLAKEVAGNAPTGIEQIVNAANYPVPPTPPVPPSIPSVPNVVPPGEPYIPPSNLVPAAQPAPVPPQPSLYGSNLPPAPPTTGPYPLPDITGQPPIDPNNLRFTDAMQAPGTNSSPFGPTQSAMNVPPGADRFPVQAANQMEPAKSAMNEVMGGQPEPFEYINNTAYPRPDAAATPAPSTGLEGLLNKGIEYAKNNPLSSLSMANTAYGLLNKPKPYEKEKYKSTFKPGLYTGYDPVQPTPYRPQYAHGGLADLGGYSDGGRMLKGPGDGMSDDIPATIANKQPARLANEEFVIPADVVSHLGNGSSEAGAKVL